MNVLSVPLSESVLYTFYDVLQMKDMLHLQRLGPHVGSL